MSQRKIAVIMSIYKNDVIQYVKLAVESILYQTYRNFDFFIQYDGPVHPQVDNYISSLSDERVKVYKREENMGLAQSLNDLLAIVMPQGYEYIARMDADDISVLDRFEKQISYLCEHKDIDCLGGAIKEIDEKGNERGKVTKYPCSIEDTRKFFKKRNPVAHPTVIMRRTLFDKAGCYYPKDFVRNEDTMLWYRAYMGGAKIANLPDILLHFRITDDMFTKRRNGKSFAKSQLKMRLIINKNMKYGIMGNFYAYAMYLLMISPTCLLKLAYRILR